MRLPEFGALPAFARFGAVTSAAGVLMAAGLLLARRPLLGLAFAEPRSGPQAPPVARADQAPGFQPAGTYVPPFGTTAETLDLAADGTFRYVYGGHRPEDRYASEGSYRLVEGMVILSPSREEGESGIETPRRLVPIQMGRSWFLVPEEHTVAFCAWSAGWPDPGDPRLPYLEIVYRRGDGDDDLESEPQLPPAWRAFYRGLLGRRFGRVPESPSSGAGALTRGPLPEVERPPFPLLEERDPQVPWETVDDEWFSLFVPGRTGFDFPVVARLYARRDTGATVLCIQLRRAAYLASPDGEWFTKGGGQRFARYLFP